MTYDNVRQLRQRGDGEIYRAIMAGQDFDASAMRGVRNVTAWTRDMEHPTAWFSAHTGSLPIEWAEVMWNDQPDYVVYSYRTPIAWHVPNDSDHGDNERWVVPAVKYSRSTSKHQNLVRTALVFNGKEAIEYLSQAREA